MLFFSSPNFSDFSIPLPITPASTATIEKPSNTHIVSIHISAFACYGMRRSISWTWNELLEVVLWNQIKKKMIFIYYHLKEKKAINRCSIKNHLIFLNLKCDMNDGNEVVWLQLFPSTKDASLCFWFEVLLDILLIFKYAVRMTFEWSSYFRGDGSFIWNVPIKEKLDETLELFRW